MLKKKQKTQEDFMMNKRQPDEEVIRGVLDAALIKDEDLEKVTGGNNDIDMQCDHPAWPDQLGPQPK